MKHMTLTAALGLFGLLMFGTSAHAQVTSFDVSNPNPAEGDWHVVVTETGNAFSVKVTADTGLLKPASDADEVTVTVLNNALNPMSATNTGGGTVGAGGGPWTKIANGDTMDWKWTSALFPAVHALDNANANYFLGSFNIAPLPGEHQQWVDVTVYDSVNGPWTETEELAPEAPSLALLLPGLIPLGIALRRRRKTRD
jgi:hypothetical protein